MYMCVGVCLLMVEIILNTFDDDELLSASANPVDSDNKAALEYSTLSDTHIEGNRQSMKLEKKDAMYFLLTLACSSNIGSALTYTGNPQNMIVAQDAVSVMSPLLFLGYMLVPSILAWIMSESLYGIF